MQASGIINDERRRNPPWIRPSLRVAAGSGQRWCCSSLTSRYGDACVVAPSRWPNHARNAARARFWDAL